MKTTRAAYAFMAILVGSATSFGASAATLVDLSGQVKYNVGKGFKVAQEAQTVAPGSKVMAGVNSSANVQFEDGCRVALNPGQVLTITAKSPCSTQASTEPSVDAYVAQQTDGGLSGPVIVGGVIVAGGITGVILANQNNGKSSP